MATSISELDRDRARFYSSLLSRSFFEKLMADEAAVGLVKRIERFDHAKLEQDISLSQYLRSAYRYLSKEYQNEYVYKNTLIRKLIHLHSNKDTVIFSEFKVGRSYADIVMFNGESRVYEIKTELDSQTRLSSQLKDYKGLFQKIYIVTHENLVSRYADYDETLGIIALTSCQGKVSLKTIREPKKNEWIDVNTLMQTLHTNEYKTLVKKIFGNLPNVGNFQMYKACMEALSNINKVTLQEEAINIIKKRKSITQYLKRYERSTSCLTQLCLSMHLSPTQYDKLHQILQKSII